MTDARLRGEWLTAAAHDGLSDAAYRVLHNALMYSAEQGTDGAIDRRALRFLYPGALDPAWLVELERAGFWDSTEEGAYLLRGWDTDLGQSTADQVARNRQNARERQARHRSRGQAGENPNTGTQGLRGAPATSDDADNVTRDTTSDVTHHVGQDRTGQATPALSDLTKTSSSQSSSERASASTDSISPMTARLAGQRGVSLGPIMQAVARHASRDITTDQAFRLSLWILEKARTAPAAPQRYVLAAIAKGWTEIQQHIDEEIA